MSEWADRFRVIPEGGSAEPGPWKTSRAEFQREPMDAITDPDTTDVVICAAIQLLKSEVELNAIGYYMHLDPCAMIMVQPDEKNAEDFSKDRIASMIEATPELQERVFKRQGGRSSKKSTKFNIGFKGGYLAIASANVEASLSSKPARCVWFDEVDKYPAHSNKGKDPIDLGKGRTTNFWNKKRAYVSSPGRLDSSRIIPLYEKSDRRKYYVPCPHCGTCQILKWGGKDVPYGIKWFDNDPTTAHYVCEGCEESLFEADKLAMLPYGQWKAHAPFTGIAGFWISSLYSPWFSWIELVRDYLESKDDPAKLQVFINTRLAEGWEERGESVNDETLLSQREPYPAKVPDAAYVLTCGVDVQKDRIEALVYGWGKDEEAWAIEHAVFWGTPKEKQVWIELESYLNSQFLHQSGVYLSLSATVIDAGYEATKVYDFVKGMEGRRVFAIKGDDGWERPTLSPPQQKRTGKDARKVELFIVGVDTVKSTVYQRLRKGPGGPYSYHFPAEDWCDEEFFKQITAEKVVLSRDKYGFASRVWRKKRERNEILDMTCYNLAALKLLAPNWQDWRINIIPPEPVKQPENEPLPSKQQISQEQQPRKRGVRNKGVSL